MKPILAALILFTAPLNAFDLTLEWDANPVEDAVTSYAIYEKTTNQGVAIYTKVGSAPGTATVIEITGIQQSRRIYVATASNATGESGYSNEVFVTPPPGPPTRLRVKIKERN